MTPAVFQTAPQTRVAEKAALFSYAAITASRLGVNVYAHAVLFHLLAESWLGEEGWTAHLRQQELVTRLGISADTIARALKKLDPIIEYRPGKGGRPSRYVFRSVSAGGRTPCPLAAEEWPPVSARERTPCPPGSGHGSGETQEKPPSPSGRAVRPDRTVPTGTGAEDGGDEKFWSESRRAAKEELISAGVETVGALTQLSLLPIEEIREAVRMHRGAPEQYRAGRIVRTLRDRSAAERIRVRAQRRVVPSAAVTAPPEPYRPLPPLRPLSEDEAAELAFRKARRSRSQSIIDQVLGLE